MSCPVEIDAFATGRFARRVLAQGRPAIVIARFERSIYVANEAGLACIGDARLGNGPLNTLVRQMGPLPRIGAAVSVRLGTASVWRPAPMPRASSHRLGSGLASLAGIRGRGLFPLRETQPAIVALHGWIEAGIRGRAPRGVGALIGQGPGLTPAGDDLVGGALIALRALRLHARAGRLGAWALDRARRATNRISRAHLECAAAGEGGAALHALIAALLAGRRNLQGELAAIDAVGHSSGWDATAGAVLVLQCAADSVSIENPARSR